MSRTSDNDWTSKEMKNLIIILFLSLTLSGCYSTISTYPTSRVEVPVLRHKSYVHPHRNRIYYHPTGHPRHYRERSRRRYAPQIYYHPEYRIHQQRRTR